MAKQTKKPTKRVFFVRRNIDDISAFRNVTPNQQDLLDFYEGEFYGSAGAPESACSGRSVAFLHGWGMGNEAYLDAVNSFERSREAGRKSAEVREARQGSAQPVGGRGSRTENRTENRTSDRTSDRRGFGFSEQVTEGGSVFGDGEGGYEEQEDMDARQEGTKNTPEPNRQPNPLRLITEQTTEPSDTQHPVARNDDGGLKMTLSPKRACARAEEGLQDDFQEEDGTFQEFQSRRRTIDFPRRGYRPGMKTGYPV